MQYGSLFKREQILNVNSICTTSQTEDILVIYKRIINKFTYTKIDSKIDEKKIIILN